MEAVTKEKMGEIRVADEVVCVIAGLAATEVKGVKALGQDLGHDQISRSGIKELQKCMKLSFVGPKNAEVSLSLTVDGTVSIPVLSRNVIEKVSGAIESMTGIQVSSVNVSIVGVVS